MTSAGREGTDRDGQRGGHFGPPFTTHPLGTGPAGSRFALPGLAHVVEHLMFEVPSASGTPIMLDLPNHALHFNAYTAPDETHYEQLGTADALETYVGYVEARLRFDCEALGESVLARELEVVRNELRLRSDGLFDVLSQAIYPPGHPYRGIQAHNEDAVARITRDDICAFVDRFYSPATTDIVITGDVEPQVALQLIKARLGSLPAKPVSRKPMIPLTTSAKSVEVR